MRTVDIGLEGVDDMFAPDDPPEEESGAAILLGTEDGGLSHGGLDPAVDDIRGKGLYDEDGNVLIRKNNRSTRVPYITPEQWQNMTRDARAKAIREYLAGLQQER